MREFTTKGKKYWDPHPLVSFQERFTCGVIDLICTHEEQRVPPAHTRKSTADVALNLQLNFKKLFLGPLSPHRRNPVDPYFPLQYLTPIRLRNLHFHLLEYVQITVISFELGLDLATS